MDLIAERIIGKELQEIRHKPKYFTIIAFEDGAITALTEVRMEISFADDPLVVEKLVWSDEWLKIILSAGEIWISRIPTPPSSECFVYGSVNKKSLMIVDCGEE